MRARMPADRRATTPSAFNGDHCLLLSLIFYTIQYIIHRFPSLTTPCYINLVRFTGRNPPASHA